MEATLAPVALTSSEVLRYAAAFFFVLVAVAAAYALIRAGGMLGRVDKVLTDVDQEVVPLMKKTGVTLDGVNANLGNVDGITKDVADITDKIDSMANAIEDAVSKPARQAASFSAGVQTAVSSFMRRDKDDLAAEDPPEGTSAASATDNGADEVEDDPGTPPPSET